MCLDSLRAITSFHVRKMNALGFSEQEKHNPHFVEHFMKRILTYCIFEPMESSLVELMALALFGFILWNDGKYSLVTQQIVTEVQDQQGKACLVQAFGDLLKNVKKDLSRQNTKQFVQNFEKFLLLVRATLRRK